MNIEYHDSDDDLSQGWEPDDADVDSWDDDAWDDDDSVELITCPECQAEIYEEAERCPACGWYVVIRNNQLAGRPTWWLILGILGVTATLLSLCLL